MSIYQLMKNVGRIAIGRRTHAGAGRTTVEEELILIEVDELRQRNRSNEQIRNWAVNLRMLADRGSARSGVFSVRRF